MSSTCSDSAMLWFKKCGSSNNLRRNKDDVFWKILSDVSANGANRPSDNSDTTIEA